MEINIDNLDTVTLTKDGTPVSNYTSGQAITANGQYVLTARDKAGNEESVEFTIAKTQLDDTITSSEYTGFWLVTSSILRVFSPTMPLLTRIPISCEICETWALLNPGILEVM